jgi:hypothetical protein
MIKTIPGLLLATCFFLIACNKKQESKNQKHRALASLSSAWSADTSWEDALVWEPTKVWSAYLKPHQLLASEAVDVVDIYAGADGKSYLICFKSWANLKFILSCDSQCEKSLPKFNKFENYFTMVFEFDSLATEYSYSGSLTIDQDGADQNTEAGIEITRILHGKLLASVKEF